MPIIVLWMVILGLGLKSVKEMASPVPAIKSLARVGYVKSYEAQCSRRWADWNCPVLGHESLTYPYRLGIITSLTVFGGAEQLWEKSETESGVSNFAKL